MRKLALVPLVGLVTLVAILGVLTSGPRSAQADLQPPCPGPGTPTPTPGAGKNVWNVAATYPTTAPANANGVCISFTGAGGQNNSAVLLANAPGCASPTVYAGGNLVSADWTTNYCVQPGDSVRIAFRSGSGPLGTPTVVWNCRGVVSGTPTPTSVPGTGSLDPPSVGGVADVTGDAAAASTTTQDSSSTPYAAIAGAAAAIALVVVAGGWYARRRWLT